VRSAKEIEVRSLTGKIESFELHLIMKWITTERYIMKFYLLGNQDKVLASKL
jgi:hypothetical protein